MTNKKKGFTLIMALMVINIVLAVGLGVFDIVLREIRLSGIGRESQKAFYAAETGIECGTYNVFTVSDPVSCAGNVVGNVPVRKIITSAPDSIDFSLNLENGSCVEVNITSSDITSTGAKVTIRSKGYNIDCGSSSSYKVERGVQKTIIINL